jgi:hypothetical protein
VSRALRLPLVVGAAWLPLVALGLWHNDAAILRDLSLHARLLIATPILILGDAPLRLRLCAAGGRLAERHAPGSGLEAETRLAARFGSAPAQATIACLIYLAAAAAARLHQPASAAGWWRLLVAMPLFRFALGRTLWQLGVWSLFLVSAARARLELDPTHPDRAGGLLFLGDAALSFRPLLLAASAVLCASLFREPSATTARLGTLAGLTALAFLGPLATFAPRLRRLRRETMRQLGGPKGPLYDRSPVVAGGRPPAIAPEDARALVHVGTLFERAGATRLLPCDRRAVRDLAAALALPILPLAAFQPVALTALRQALKLLW